MSHAYLLASTLVLAAACAPGSPRAPAADPRPSAAYPVMAPLEEYLIADRDAEVALARTAAPPAISNHATVLVLTRQGYKTAVEGKSAISAAAIRNTFDRESRNAALGFSKRSRSDSSTAAT